MWLDVARYAEDQAHIVGNNSSLFYPNAYLYRDWLIKAFNDDMPYDEMIRQQLAADLIAPQNLEAHAALGFVGLGPQILPPRRPGGHGGRMVGSSGHGFSRDPRFNRRLCSVP